MINRSLTPVLLALLHACDAGGPIVAEDAEGAFAFDLVSPASRTEDADGQLWVSPETGVRVTAQRIPVDDQVLRGRDVSGVAEAIATMHELGAIDGTLSRETCRLGGELAECLTGFVEQDGETYSRRMGVVQLGDEIVVLGVLDPVSAALAVREQWELIERTLRPVG